ncbi:hypothetical protein A5714_19380 [Mycobacterium sp. E2462]|uniref:YbaB/EbfC family nucleoid-associated protein n=1 Tax=Mycobacterium sp. E2462 TaxID=1834133 RepID=UPI0007FE61CB|nr:YbaB/EbfC family nucleoid-associated protein [Mycobacterium sp. E2462]OBI09684.1 hypothetical protein A5714_19380 [Mycobacterium sp. E2462]
MDNDAMNHDLTHVLSLVQEQMRDLAVMQQRRAALTATATAADGTVEITVDAQRMVTNTVIDESYLDEYEFADLAGHITAAAQQAVQEIERQSAALLAPLNQRRQDISSLSGLVADLPDFGSLLSGLSAPEGTPSRLRDGGDAQDEDPSFPTVRR